jgi:hypothetical protein
MPVNSRAVDVGLAERIDLREVEDPDEVHEHLRNVVADLRWCDWRTRERERARRR